MQNSVKYKNWKEKIDASLTDVKIDVEKVDYFGSNVGFIKLRVSGVKDNGKPISSIVMVRGDSVSVLVVVKTEKRKYYVVTKQYRAPVGKWIIENPAGMMDENLNPKGVAVAEIEEELGIKLRGNDLKPLGEFYNSPGLLDEKTSIFFTEISMTEEQVNFLRGRETGVDTEDIIVEVLTKKEFLSQNESAISALAFMKYKQYQQV